MNIGLVDIDNIKVCNDQPEYYEIVIKGGNYDTIGRTKPIKPQYLEKGRFLSEFATEKEKAKVRTNLGINNLNSNWGNITGNIEDQKDLYNNLQELRAALAKLEGQLGSELDAQLSFIQQQLDNKINKELPLEEDAVNQIAYTNTDYPNINNIGQALDQLLYKDLAVSFRCTPSVAEAGSVVPQITYSWTINKSNIFSQTFDGNVIPESDRTYVLNENITSNITKTLTVNDGRNEVAKQASLVFYPPIYFGSNPNTQIFVYDIQYKLNKVLLPSRKTTVTVDAGNTDYIYICVPYDYEPASFVVGGFEGGFMLLSDTFYLPTETKKEIRYRVYRSDNKGLGVTRITII